MQSAERTELKESVASPPPGPAKWDMSGISALDRQR